MLPPSSVLNYRFPNENNLDNAVTETWINGFQFGLLATIFVLCCAVETRRNQSWVTIFLIKCKFDVSFVVQVRDRTIYITVWVPKTCSQNHSQPCFLLRLNHNLTSSFILTGRFVLDLYSISAEFTLLIKSPRDLLRSLISRYLSSHSPAGLSNKFGHHVRVHPVCTRRQAE
jgi:hypothetical protein